MADESRQILKNHPRPPVPPALADKGVTEEQWNKIYDEAVAQQDSVTAQDEGIRSCAKARLAIGLACSLFFFAFLMLSVIMNTIVWALISMFLLSLPRFVLGWQKFIQANCPNTSRQILKNHPRSLVPPILANKGVTEEQWNKIYDEAVAHQEQRVAAQDEDGANARFAIGLVWILTFLVLLILSLITDYLFWFFVSLFFLFLPWFVLGWEKLIEAKMRKYCRSGVGSGTGGIVRDLEALNALHQSGALTAEEFAVAKAHVLGLPVLPGAGVVSNDVVKDEDELPPVVAVADVALASSDEDNKNANLTDNMV